MFRNTYATVGQNQRQVLLHAPRESVGRNCKLQIGSHSAFPLPPSAFPLPPFPFRLGITLTEVLISLGILAIGLLGVAALFPVGSYYMQQGEVADRASAVAQAAFNEAVARGMLSPKNWLMLETQKQTGDDRVLSSFSKQFSRALASQLAENLLANDTTLAKQQTVNTRLGYAYVIDPLGVEGSPVAPTSAASRLEDRIQARIVQTLPYNAMLSGYPLPQWWPWRPVSLPTSPASSPILEPRWPIVRVTLPQPGPEKNWPMTRTAAEGTFSSRDDLALSLPGPADRPSVQPWQTTVVSGSTIPLQRQFQGDYSWMITIVPPHAEARNALANNPSAYEYEVSVAVFYKRVIDNLMTDSSINERLTVAKVVSTGLSGGELLIEKSPIDAAADPFGGLKSGNWVAVCGPHPSSSNEMPRFVFRWYRVLSVEGEDRRLDSQGSYDPPPAANDPERRLVALRGPQWPWRPEPSRDLTASHLSNNLCLVVIPNVVAVHSKTMRLEGKSAWSFE